MCLAQSVRTCCFRFWHQTDLTGQADNVRSPGQSRPPAARPRLPVLTPYQTSANHAPFHNFHHSPTMLWTSEDSCDDASL